MKNAAIADGSPLAGLPDYQAVVLWDYIKYLDELLDYALSCAGDMDAGTLHGLTSRIGALRGGLAGGLPPDPRLLPFARGPAVN
jgi:hypothetical protein